MVPVAAPATIRSRKLGSSLTNAVLWTVALVAIGYGIGQLARYWAEKDNDDD